MSSLDEEPGVARAAAAGGREKRAYVRDAFSRIAPRYDLLNHLLSANVDRGWRRRAIAALDWRRRPDGRYLDLCAGTLDIAAMLLRQRGFRGHVIGADFAVPMLAAGRGKAPRERLSPVAADALELPFDDGSIDGAIAAFGVRNLAGLDAGIAEVARVLRPGGRFVILEFSTPRSPVLRRLYHLYFHRILPVLGGLISGHPTAYRYLPESIAHFPAEEALAERMRAAGFAEVGWESLTFGIAAIHVGVRATRASPVPADSVAASAAG